MEKHAKIIFSYIFPILIFEIYSPHKQHRINHHLRHLRIAQHRSAGGGDNANSNAITRAFLV